MGLIEQAVNWMRTMWVKGNNALLADVMGLGKTASVITFIQCLRSATLHGVVVLPSTPPAQESILAVRITVAIDSGDMSLSMKSIQAETLPE